MTVQPFTQTTGNIPTFGSTLRIYALEARYELMKMIRLPAYSIPSILFPLVFYVFFGVGLNNHASAGTVSATTYLLATYGAFGVIGASVFGFGVTVAIERGQGWMQLKRTTPMPAAAYFVSKIVMAMLFSTVIVFGLMALGVLFGHVVLTPLIAAKLFTVLIVGTIPFGALGLAIGYLAGPNSAAPIVNIIYLPMSFLSGLWIPIWMLPKPLQMLAFFLPPFHYSQLALRVLGGSRGMNPMIHVVALLTFTVLFLAIAAVGYRRDEGKSYG